MRHSINPVCMFSYVFLSSSSNIWLTTSTNNTTSCLNFSRFSNTLLTNKVGSNKNMVTAPHYLPKYIIFLSWRLVSESRTTRISKIGSVSACNVYFCVNSRIKHGTRAPEEPFTFITLAIDFRYHFKILSKAQLK